MVAGSTLIDKSQKFINSFSHQVSPYGSPATSMSGLKYLSVDLDMLD